MAQITIPDLLQNEFADIETLQDYLDLISNEINGSLDNTNIAANANIDPDKIAGGAVVETDVTEVGAASKIPRINSSGDFIITGELIFQEGSI